MRKVTARVRRLWATLRPGTIPTVPYEVACTCGRLLRGLRRSRHQVVPCVCGRPVFVLPCSPFVTSGSSPHTAEPISTERNRELWLWLGPLLAALCTLAAVMVIYALVFRSLAGGSSAHYAHNSEQGGDFRVHQDAAREALRRGNFRRAVTELEQAQTLLEQGPQAADKRTQSRQVRQLQLQVELLADLLSESAEEILQRAAGLPEEEWQAQFVRRYRGHALIFDDDVREQEGHFSLRYEVRAGMAPARIDPSDLQLLALLPARRRQQPRLLWGGRVASVQREPPGVWVMRFEPTSGVLLTDPDVVAACCPPPLTPDDQKEREALLLRQAEWLRELGAATRK